MKYAKEINNLINRGELILFSWPYSEQGGEGAVRKFCLSQINDRPASGL